MTKALHSEPQARYRRGIRQVDGHCLFVLKMHEATTKAFKQSGISSISVEINGTEATE
jgi:hypothetical protein